MSRLDQSPAGALSTSAPPCWRRIQKLRASGVIQLNADGRANVTEFTRAVQLYPEVLECHITLGTMDCLLRIVAASIQAYEAFFFNCLSTLPWVHEVNSVVSLSEIKSTTALPAR